MATEISVTKCGNCGEMAYVEDRPYSVEIRCSCGYSFSEKFLGTGTEFLTEDWYVNMLAEGYVAVEAVTLGGETVTLIRKTVAGVVTRPGGVC